jgi:hypothetical protein
MADSKKVEYSPLVHVVQVCRPGNASGKHPLQSRITPDEAPAIPNSAVKRGQSD